MSGFSQEFGKVTACTLWKIILWEIILWERHPTLCKDLETPPQWKSDSITHRPTWEGSRDANASKKWMD